MRSGLHSELQCYGTASIQPHLTPDSENDTSITIDMSQDVLYDLLMGQLKRACCRALKLSGATPPASPRHPWKVSGSSDAPAVSPRKQVWGSPAAAASLPSSPRHETASSLSATGQGHFGKLADSGKARSTRQSLSTSPRKPSLHSPSRNSLLAVAAQLAISTDASRYSSEDESVLSPYAVKGSRDTHPFCLRLNPGSPRPLQLTAQNKAYRLSRSVDRARDRRRGQNSATSHSAEGLASKAKAVNIPSVSIMSPSVIAPPHELAVPLHLLTQSEHEHEQLHDEALASISNAKSVPREPRAEGISPAQNEAKEQDVNKLTGGANARERESRQAARQHSVASSDDDHDDGEVSNEVEYLYRPSEDLELQPSKENIPSQSHQGPQLPPLPLHALSDRPEGGKSSACNSRNLKVRNRIEDKVVPGGRRAGQDVYCGVLSRRQFRSC